MKSQFDKKGVVKKLLTTCSGVVLVGGLSAAVTAAPTFTDVAVDAGVGSEVYRGLTNHSLGINWIDYDEDGWPDMFLVNGFNSVPHLYHNNQDGTFSLVDDLLPTLENAELSGSFFADYDNDGDSDIFIGAIHETLNLTDSNDLSGPANILLKNMYVENGNAVVAGEPLFVDVAEAAGVTGLLDAPIGVYAGANSMTGGWFDYDRDGCVDLYVGTLVLQSAGDTSNFNSLYKNNCDGTFTDVTAVSGDVASLNPDDLRPSLVFIGAHLDNDLDPDIYVVNVHEVSPHHLDFLYQNNADGTFSETSALSPGIGDDAGSGMGIDVSDIDLDGDWDIYIADLYGTTNDELPLGNALYLSNGDGTWAENNAVAAGVEGRFSWGTEFFDLNNNGYEDLYVTSEGNDLLYLNNMDGTFTDIADAAGVNQIKIGRGAISADYDGDGDLDVAVVYQGFSVALLRNDTPEMGNWLQLTLEGTESNRDAIGALVKMTVGDKMLMRQVISASSTHSQAPLALHFGVGEETVASEIRVLWPSGLEDVYENVAVNARLTLTEGETVAPPMTIASVEPSAVAIGQTVDLTVKGENFDLGTSCILFELPNVRVVRTIFVNNTTLIVTVQPRRDSALGFGGLGCTSSQGEQARVRDAFEVVQ